MDRLGKHMFGRKVICRLFNENYDYALYRYEDFTSYSIIDVRWSFARPFEFYVLDSNSTLFIFSFFSKENWVIVATI